MENNTLPQGWRKVLSKSKGLYFYYNSTTKESTWKEPTSKVVPAVDKPRKTSTSVTAAPSKKSYDVQEEDNEMEITLGDDGCIEMDVEIIVEQMMITELNSCRTNLKVALPTQNDKMLYGLPVEAYRVNYSDFLYLVLDTNVLLSHLKFLKELKDHSIKDIGKPVLVIPWVVIQELDALKKANRHVATQASNAGKFINDCLSVQHPRVRGQTVEEVNTETQNLAIENNDDRILHCCLVYQYKIRMRKEQGVVVLFSNDTLLCAKAKINGIFSCNRKTLLKDLKSLSQSCSRGAVSYTQTPEYLSQVGKQLAEDEKQKTIDDCLCQAEGYVRDAFSVAIDHEMKEVYGNLSLDIMVRKPPWNLEDVVYMLDKHWVAVFRYYFPHNTITTQEKVKNLLTHVRRSPSRMPHPPDVLLFINNALFIIEQLRNKQEVWSKVGLLVASLKVIREKVEKSHLPSPPSTPPHSISGNVSSMPLSAQLQSQSSIQSYLPRLSDNLQQMVQQCPPLPVSQFYWIFQIIRESLINGIISAQTALTACSFSRQSEVNLLDMLRYLESLIIALEGLLTQGIFIPLLRNLYDAIESYLNHVVNTSSPLVFQQLCDLCQLEGTLATFQDALSFMLDGRLQLLQLLHQTAQHQS